MASFQGLHKVLDAMNAPENQEKRAEDAFIQHVRECSQCETKPAHLCPTGRKLIRKVIEIWDGEVCKCGELPNHCTCQKD